MSSPPTAPPWGVSVTLLGQAPLAPLRAQLRGMIKSVSDDFVVTERGILGAGNFVRYGGLEKVVVDALEGNDTFFIQSTSESLAIEIVGGLGSDSFHVGHRWR